MTEQFIQKKELIERTSIAVPRNIFAILKYIAIKEGTNVTQLTLQYITEGLKKEPIVNENDEFKRDIEIYVLQQQEKKEGRWI